MPFSSLCSLPDSHSPTNRLRPASSATARSSTAPATPGSTATWRSAATGSSPSASVPARGSDARSTPRAWSSRPASSTCTRIPTTLLLEDGDAQSKVRQGVTTEVLGEGSSAGPYKGKLPPHGRRSRQGATLDTLGGYFDALEKPGVAVNVASYVGLDNVWQCVMGTSYDRPTAEQFERDEGARRRGDEGRGVRPVDACWRCRPARWRRPTTSSSCARSSRSTAASTRRTSATRGPASSTRSRRRSPSASGPACRWTSSTSRSPTRSSGAG